MKTVYDYLKQEHRSLQKQISYIKSHQKDYPDGLLEVSYSNGCPQYYRLERSGSGKGRKKTYIKSSDRKIAEALAQRDYERRLLQCLEKREKAVCRMQTAYEGASPENVAGSFAKGRQKLIRPLILSDEQYVEKWLSEAYEGKAFPEDAPEIITNNGEKVRSKSEKIIADTLAKYNIPYKYECPLVLSNQLVIYPDFRVLNVRCRKEIVYEHFGMVGEEDYTTIVIKKINTYISSGFFPGDGLIFTMEGNGITLSTKIVELMIEKYLV